MEEEYLLPEKKEAYYEAKANLLYSASQPERRFEVGLFHSEFPAGLDIIIAVAPKTYIGRVRGDPQRAQRRGASARSPSFQVPKSYHGEGNFKAPESMKEWR